MHSPLVMPTTSLFGLNSTTVNSQGFNRYIYLYGAATSEMRGNDESFRCPSTYETPYFKGWLNTAHSPHSSVLINPYLAYMLRSPPTHTHNRRGRLAIYGNQGQCYRCAYASGFSASLFTKRSKIPDAASSYNQV